MEKNKIADLLNTLEQTCLTDLEEELEEEINKPSENRDLEKIRELIETISYIKGDDSVVSHSKQIEQLNEDVKRERAIFITRRRKQLVALAACAVVLFGLNQASLNAYGENVFKRVYHFTKGGVSIMIGENDDTEPTEPPTAPPATGATAPEEEVIELPTYPGDPYGIKAVCAKYGIYPMTPSYIPEGFELIEITEDDDAKITDVVFRYIRGDKKINLYYTYYNIDNVSTGIPIDTNNIQELTINNNIFTVVKEDNQMKAFYIDGKLKCNIFTYNIDYSETDRMLYSFT